MLKRFRIEFGSPPEAIVDVAGDETVDHPIVGRPRSVDRLGPVLEWSSGRVPRR
jgi:hypothetical protein